MSQQTPRRWSTFGLRSLFLLVLIVAAYFSGWRSARWTAERDKQAAVRKAVEEVQAAKEAESRANVTFGSGMVLGFSEASSVEELLLPEDSRDLSQVTAAEDKPPLRSP